MFAAGEGKKAEGEGSRMLPHKDSEKRQHQKKR